jgi:hypothetical protein
VRNIDAQKARTYWTLVALSALAGVGAIAMSKLAWRDTEFWIGSRADFDLLETAVAVIAGVAVSVWTTLSPRFTLRARQMIYVLAGGGGIAVGLSSFELAQPRLSSDIFYRWGIIDLLAMTLWLLGIMAFMYLLWRPRHQEDPS